MTIILLIFLLILLSIITYQDFTQRAISVWTIPIFYILGALISWQYNDFNQIWRFVIQNSLFIGFQIIVLSFYFSLKERKWVNIVDQWLGLGDILFFFGVGCLFSPVNFIAFFIGSIFLVLMFFIFIKLFVRNLQTIPLAGGMALPLMLLFGVLFFKNNSFHVLYEDKYLLQWLVNNTSIY